MEAARRLFRPQPSSLFPLVSGHLSEIRKEELPKKSPGDNR